MISLVTSGIKISVETAYQPEYSNEEQMHFVFSYHITIENTSEYTVQLLTRHWYIFDSNSTMREIIGEGVIGYQPIIEPGQSHKYISGCNLKSDIGKMVGTYTMERVFDGKKFKVFIPEFILITPYKLN